jgi:thioredoxin-dependent peroxiredoxin
MKTLLLGLMAFAATNLFHFQADNSSDFVVPSALDDSEFQLSEHRGKTVVLHFLLKTECPFCLKYTHDYAKLAADTPDVVHLFLKPDSVKEIQEWASHIDKKDLKDLPKIYRDAEAKLASRFKIPDGYKFHGQSVHYPALVAIDGQGKELFRYVGKSNRDRMPPAEFSKRLAMTK